jgi:hypothetical protein
MDFVVEVTLADHDQPLHGIASGATEDDALESCVNLWLNAGYAHDELFVQSLGSL